MMCVWECVSAKVWFRCYVLRNSRLDRGSAAFCLRQSGRHPRKKKKKAVIWHGQIRAMSFHMLGRHRQILVLQNITVKSKLTEGAHSSYQRSSEEVWLQVGGVFVWTVFSLHLYVFFFILQKYQVVHTKWTHELLK